MDHSLVLPRFRALAPGAYLAIVDNENVHGSYGDAVCVITDGYAAVAQHPETSNAIAVVRACGLFNIEGEERTAPMPFEQSVDEYIEFLHSTSVLARAQLGERDDTCDDEVRTVLAQRGIKPLRYGVVGWVTWAVARQP